MIRPLRQARLRPATPTAILSPCRDDAQGSRSGLAGKPEQSFLLDKLSGPLPPRGQANASGSQYRRPPETSPLPAGFR